MIQITLPWPPAALLPNNRNGRHWSSTQGPKEAYKDTVYKLCRQSLGYVYPDLPEGPVRLLIQFYPPDRRKRDDDGMIGAFKHGRDMVALALGVDDVRFRPTYEICEPVKGGDVILTIQK